MVKTFTFSNTLRLRIPSLLNRRICPWRAVTWSSGGSLFETIPVTVVICVVSLITTYVIVGPEVALISFDMITSIAPALVSVP